MVAATVQLMIYHQLSKCKGVSYWHEKDIPDRRRVMPSPVGGQVPWSPAGYGAWRVVSTRSQTAASLRSDSWKAIAPEGPPAEWVNQGAVPEGWSVRGLLLLAACQCPFLMESDGPGQGSLVNRLWTTDFALGLDASQPDRLALVNDALTTATHLWNAPRFTAHQKACLGDALLNRLHIFLPNHEHFDTNKRLAQVWPVGSNWDAQWEYHAKRRPELYAARRAVAASEKELPPSTTARRVRMRG